MGKKYKYIIPALSVIPSLAGITLVPAAATAEGGGCCGCIIFILLLICFLCCLGPIIWPMDSTAILFLGV